MQNRWLITFTVMMVAVAEVLDMTIVTVAMPHMMGNLGATTDQITWILTAYIVAAAVCMPMTGFLAKRFGQKKLLLANISGFCLASILCGVSGSLNQLVFFRILQGCFGAALVPLSQTILRSVFPKAEHAKAMAIWGVGIMVGPVLGPTLGGYITESFSWRWIFYINVPICFLSFFLTQRHLQETATQKDPIDWLGLLIMILAIGSLQFFLDRGNEENWFESFFMISLCAFSFFMFVFFIVRGLNTDNHIINLSLFANKNFAVCSLLIIVFGLSLFGTMAIAPTMLQQLMGYPASEAGLLMAPQALASAMVMLLIARWVHHFDGRKVIGLGLLLSAAGAYARSQINLDINAWQFIWPSLVQGVGTGLFFVPLTTTAFATLKKMEDAEAAGLYSFCRSIGSSIGISIVATIITRESMINWQRLGSQVNQYNANLQTWLDAHQLTLDNPLAAKLLAKTIEQQAAMVAYVDAFWFIAISTVALIPLLFLLDSPKKS